MKVSAVIKHYGVNAPIYDLLMVPFVLIRWRAISWLNLYTGATVVDLGCGTGPSFAGLLDPIDEGAWAPLEH